MVSLHLCMIKKVLFSLLSGLMFFSSEGQTFVDDIDRVAIVVIDYCVDTNGERFNIVLNEEKTTYKNKAWQDGCITYFKDASLMQPMAMVDDCWQAVYYFVNSKYKTYELPAVDQAKCKVFHLGEYKYESPAYNKTQILRRKHKQIEKSPIKDQRQVYAIEWLEDHIYTLTALKLPLEKDKNKVGNLLKVEIIELIGDNSYLYRASIKDDPNVIYGDYN